MNLPNMQILEWHARVEIPGFIFSEEIKRQFQSLMAPEHLGQDVPVSLLLETKGVQMKDSQVTQSFHSVSPCTQKSFVKKRVIKHKG